MDMEPFKADLEKALRLLPSSMFTAVKQIVVDHIATVPQILPQLIPLLAPHGRALTFELSTQVLSLSELEPILRETFAKVAGQDFPTNGTAT